MRLANLISSHPPSPGSAKYWRQRWERCTEETLRLEMKPGQVARRLGFGTGLGQPGRIGVNPYSLRM